MRILLFTALYFSLSINAVAKDHPYSAEYAGQINQLVMDGARLSESKLNQLINRIETKHSEVVGLNDGRLERNSILINKYRRKGHSDNKIIKKLSKHEVHLAFEAAISALRSLNTRSTISEVLSKVNFALDMEESMSIEGKGSAINTLLDYARALRQTWTINKIAQAYDEATNLENTRTKKYLNQQDISGIKSYGYDLSKYEPVSDNSFWQRQSDISKIKISDSSKGRNLELYKNIDIEFPQNNVLHYDSIKKSDTKPKVNTYFKNSRGKELDIKLKVGAEMHSDVTAAVLMNTLGFPGDVSVYRKNIKLVLGKTTYDEFAAEWESYYKRDGGINDSFVLENYVTETGSDRTGNYIVFKEGLMEAKPKQLMRLGAWDISSESKSSLREVRALMLVQMWIANADIKFGNSKIVLRKNKSGSVKPYYIISDTGFTFGHIFREKPDQFGWELVERQSADSLVLRYETLHKQAIKNKITVADAKWTTRLIAQLTREQIQQAVSVGGWPKCIATIYTEKLISRRNNLVSELGLEGDLLPSGKTIQLIPLQYKKEDLKYDNHCNKNEITQNYTQDYNYDMSHMVGRVLSVMGSTAADISTALLNDSGKISLRSADFDLALGQVTEVIIDPKRAIEPNPNSTSSTDAFIVKDSVEIGIRLGAKYGVFADLVKSQKYTLAYPVRSYEEGKLKNNFLVNALLPLQLARKDLPSKYVLEVSNYIENGVGIEIDDKLSLVSPGLRLGYSPRVFLTKSVLDHRDTKNIVYYNERSKYSKAIAEAFIRLGIIKWSLFDSISKSGSALGKGVIFNSEELYGDRNMAALVDQAMKFGDHTFLGPLETEFNLENDFFHKERSWSLFFTKGKRNKRLDHIRLEDMKMEMESIQYATSSGLSTKSPTNMESKKVAVEVYSDATSPDKFHLQLSIMGVDAVTKTNELADSYLTFINGLHPNQESVIPFSAKLGYSKNDLWGHLIVTSETTYYPEGVAKLLSATEKQFWEHMARALNVTERDMQVLRQNFKEFRRAGQSRLLSRRKALEAYGLTRASYITIFSAERFVRRLNKAKDTDDITKKVERLAEAFRKAAYDQNLEIIGVTFYSPEIFAAINSLVGEKHLYSRNQITNAGGKEVNLVEGEPLYGEFGQAQQSSLDYLIFAPVGAAELYNMFDSWF